MCQRHDFIYAYNGTYWELIDGKEFKTFLGLASQKVGHKGLEGQHYEFRDKLFKQFFSAAYLPTPIISDEVVLINLKNGTLEITPKGFKLREHRKADFMTYQLPFAFDPLAKCPRFEKYLLKVLPESQCRDILAEFMGYSFTRKLKLEKCLLLYGDGANGKSVFFEVMYAVYGRENISTLSLGSLKEEHNRAMLSNKLLNYGSEINSGAIEVDTFKQLASGEPVQARLKYGNSFMMEFYSKLAFNCNALPSVSEYSEAFFRRFVIIPFDITIPEKDRDPNLSSDIIENELAGVFNWILVGLTRLLQNNKFTTSEKVKAILNRYRISSDTVALFLEEQGYRPCVDSTMSLAHLYDKYKTYCVTGGYRSISNRNFSDRLKKLGFESTRKNSGTFIYAAYAELSSSSL
ncbi:DNA primase family protein [Taibaiella soli]|uniref:DNA primase n=1 Tax=Taibaiella soli TaxID=1649169 RepID=A0A2W2BKE9_9BACT|nr:DNA primase family protein [Taibaiella soli]PZF73936.1 DNA primase [Taibaiella soli]